jgi:hypothetical protein
VIALSPRFAGAAIALFAAAALPVGYHALAAPIHDDCANPEAFFDAPRIGGADMEPLGGWMRDLEGGEGRLPDGRGYRVAVRVVRTFSPSLLNASPLRFGFDDALYLRPGEVRWLEAGDAVLPVHWISYEGRDATRFEAYSFVRDGVPVSNPFRSGLALALPQLVGGTRPITVLIASGAAVPDGRAASARAAERWFVRAWQQLEAACGS